MVLPLSPAQEHGATRGVAARGGRPLPPPHGLGGTGGASPHAPPPCHGHLVARPHGPREAAFWGFEALGSLVWPFGPDPFYPPHPKSHGGGRVPRGVSVCGGGGLLGTGSPAMLGWGDFSLCLKTSLFCSYDRHTLYIVV